MSTMDQIEVIKDINTMDSRPWDTEVNLIKEEVVSEEEQVVEILAQVETNRTIAHATIAARKDTLRVIVKSETKSGVSTVRWWATQFKTAVESRNTTQTQKMLTMHFMQQLILYQLLNLKHGC
jgi:hypothetical protein